MKNNSVVGAVESFISVLKANTAALNAAGVAVNAIVTELEDKQDVYVTKNVEQENLKTSLKDKTGEVTEAATALYDTFSSKVDSVCGAVGKKSNLAKQIARVRASLRNRPSAQDEPPLSNAA